MVSADDLRYFLAVAQRGRLVRAAAQLGVDHTTVSRRIGALERAVGQRLFDRTEQGWLLTDAGQALLAPAEQVDTAVAMAEESLGLGDDSLTGTVRISTPDAFGAYLLAPALPTLAAQHPDLVVEMVTETRPIDDAVRKVDVAVTLEKPVSSRFTYRPLTDYLLRLYATPEYLATHPPLDRPEDLAQHTVIFYVDHLLNLPALQLLQRLPVQPTLQSTNVVAQWQLAAAGGGIGVLPQFMASRDERLVPVLEDVVFKRRYWLMFSSEHARLRRVQAVVDLLQRTVAERRVELLGRIADQG